MLAGCGLDRDEVWIKNLFLSWGSVKNGMNLKGLQSNPTGLLLYRLCQVLTEWFFNTEPMWGRTRSEMWYCFSTALIQWEISSSPAAWLLAHASLLWCLLGLVIRLVFSPDCGSQINTHTYRDPCWSGGVEMRQYLRSAWKKENTVCHVQSLTNQHTHTLPVFSLANNLMNSCSHWKVIVLVLNGSVLVFTVPLWPLSSPWSVWKCSYDVSLKLKAE